MSVLGRAGVVIAIVMAAYMLFNAGVAWIDPVGFSMRLGLPIGPSDDPGWVHIYALRAAFIGLLLVGLIAARAWTALSIASFVALIMPLGDAFLTSMHGAPITTVARHLIIAALVFCAALLLSHAARTSKD